MWRTAPRAVRSSGRAEEMFSAGTAPQTPRVANRKRVRLDPTPTGVWSPSTPAGDDVWFTRPEIKFFTDTPVV